MIPYIISKAYPCYKCPEVSQEYGAIKEEKLDIFFLRNVSDFIIDGLPEEVNSVDDITSFWEDYYSEYYMNNPPYDVMIFKNDEWLNATPSDDQIFEFIKKPDNNYNNNNNNGKDLNDDEEQILEKMNKLLMEMLKNEPPESLVNLFSMNVVEQLIFILHKLAESELVEDNKELIGCYIKTHLKHINEDIEEITKNIEMNHDEKETEKLNYIIKLYERVMYYKNILD
jgi:hypothetical protein